MLIDDASTNMPTTVAHLPIYQEHAITNTAGTTGASYQEKSHCRIPSAGENFGFTSLFAVLADTIAECSLSVSMGSDQSTFIKNDIEMIHSGIHVLPLLSDITLYQSLIEKWFLLQQGLVIIPSMMRALLASIPDKDDLLGQLGPEDRLLVRSEQILTNGQGAWPSDGDLCETDYATMFTHSTLRWESVGIIVTMTGLAATRLFENHNVLTTVDGGTIQRDELIDRMTRASERCIALSLHTGPPNDLKIWLLYLNYLLQTTRSGDSSKYIPIPATVIACF